MKRLLPFTLVTLTLLCGGCALWPFSKKENARRAQPKQGSHVSTDVELEFRQRWVDKRAADLVAQGMLADSAHAQAMAEFRTKFYYTHAAQLP